MLLLHMFVNNQQKLLDMHLWLTFMFFVEKLFFLSLFTGKSSPVKMDETIYSEVKVAGAHTDNT